MNTFIKIALFVITGTWMLWAQTACTKEDDNKGTIINIELWHPQSDTGRVFKSDGLRISIPSEFQFRYDPSKGDYVFNAQNQDISVRLSYNYCDNNACNPYGIYLGNEKQAKDTIVSGGELIVLDRKAYFYRAGILLGILFYRDLNPGAGKFYWSRNGSFAEALEVEYTTEKFQQMLSILSTIR